MKYNIVCWNVIYVYIWKPAYSEFFESKKMCI